jgi:hypothetical protein
LPFATNDGWAPASGSPIVRLACICDYGGAAVAVSRSRAVVGVPAIEDAAGRAYVYSNSSGPWTQTAALVGTDTDSGDEFGAAVAISGTTAIVGAPGHAGYAGRAYVFSDTGGTWLQVAELQGADTTAGDWFGSSIAIDGSNVVVGAPARADNTGSAYVFTDGPGGWTQAAELTGQLADGYFGYAVAVSGTTVIVGGPGDSKGSGNGYVFTANGGTWTQVADLVGGDNFGAAVAVNGGIAVVGAWLRSGGAAYVFTDTSGPWVQAAQLTASDDRLGFGAAVAVTQTSVAVSAVDAAGDGGRVYVYNPVASAWMQSAEIAPAVVEDGDFFGSRALAMSGTTMVVGAPAHGNAGDAFVFTASSGAWSQSADLTVSDSIADSQTGASVAVTPKLLATGAPGHDAEGRAYEFPTPPKTYPVMAVQGSDTAEGDGFGASIAVSGSTLLVGAPGRGDAGSAYVFTDSLNAPYTEGTVRAHINDLVYGQPAELEGSDTAVGDEFGTSVAISGITAVVGAPGHAGTGRAYVFVESGGTWIQVAELEGSDTAAGEEFGESVAISGTTVVIGAPGHAGAGSAYVFTEGSIWSQTAELQGSDTTAGDEFGASVALDGSTAAIGAPGHGGMGSAYIFSASGVTWTQGAELAGSDTTGGDEFGASVAIAGTDAVVGAPEHAGSGSAYAFSESAGSWTQGDEIHDPGTAAGDGFGAAVALSGTTAAVGSPGYKGTGAVYAFAI